MAKETETTKDPIANVEDALTKSELFIEKNQKLLLMVLGGIIIVVGGIFAYRNYVVKPFTPSTFDQKLQVIAKKVNALNL
jgi:hypothetical protein